MPARKPTVFPTHIVMTASYSLLGGEEEARAEAAEALRLNPKFSVDKYAKRHLDGFARRA